MKKGFTLIEVLVVVVILIILSATAASSFNAAKSAQELKNQPVQDHRLDQLAVAFKPTDVEPTTDQICSGMDTEQERQCRDYHYKLDMINNCVAKYK